MRVYKIERVAGNLINLLNPWKLLGNYPTKILNSLKTWHINLKCVINMYLVNSTEHIYIFPLSYATKVQK